jgi:hypothetical protein
VRDHLLREAFDSLGLLREQQCELEAELPIPWRADAAWTRAENIVKCLYLRIESLAGEFEHPADAAAQRNGPSRSRWGVPVGGNDWCADQVPPLPMRYVVVDEWLGIKEIHRVRTGSPPTDHELLTTAPITQ